MAVSGSLAPGQAETPSRRSGRLRAVLGCLAVVAVLVALRLPGFFEPAWSEDAGAYANIGRALDLGGRLYGEVWDNKPPGMYWLSAADMAGGASALRAQIALSVIVALATLLVFLVGRRLATPAVGLSAAPLFAVVASVPNFTGNQLNAEIAGVLPVLAAMLLLLRRTPIPRGHAVGAGVMLGFGLLFKATFAADLLAGLAVPSLLAVARGRRPGRPELVTTLLVAAGTLALCAAAAVGVQLHGSVRALADVVLHQDPRYAAWGQLTGPLGTPPPSFDVSPSALLRAIAYSRLLVFVGGGAALAVVLARRGHRAGAVVAFWLACDLAATMVDNRALTHYVQQMTGSLALAAALLAAHLWRQRVPVVRLLAFAALPAMWLAMLGALFLPRAEAAVATLHHVPQLILENASGRQLPGYYRRAFDLVTGRITLQQYQAAFPSPVHPAAEQLAQLLDAHSAPGQRVFIWGDISGWAYAYADRLPASRFIWMDTAYRLYPDGDATLVADLRRSPPAVLIAEHPPSARLLAFLQGAGYTLADRTGVGDVWVAGTASG